MERTTFCLLFYIRRTKLNRNGEAPIMMRITVNGVRVDASVKKTILPEFWSAAKGKALEKKREYKELNLYLDSIRLRIMKIQRELEIIPVISQPLQSVQHGSGILRPENDAVHRIGSKADPAYRTRIEWIGYEYVPLLQPVIEPRRIKRRNIRSPARTYYHGAQ